MFTESQGAVAMPAFSLPAAVDGSVVIREAYKRVDINYQVLMADRTTTRNFGGVVALPTSFLVNKDGHVVKKYLGFAPHGLFERDIESVR